MRLSQSVVDTVTPLRYVFEEASLNATEIEVGNRRKLSR